MFQIDLSSHQDDIKKYLATTEFPSGWLSLIDLLVKAATTFDITLTEVKYNKGILRVQYSPSSDREANQIFQLFLNALAKESSMTCIMANEKNESHRGHRRPQEEHNPPLCATHYIQYLNSGDV